MYTDPSVRSGITRKFNFTFLRMGIMLVSFSPKFKFLQIPMAIYFCFLIKNVNLCMLVIIKPLN